ncbi:MAG: phage baseplate assembly protein, partial [Methylovirgula sp.]
MPFESVTVVAGGESYGAWQEIEIEYGAGLAARSVALRAAEPYSVIGTDWPFEPGTPMSVYASGDLLLTGFVDDYEPEFDEDNHIATVSARSKSKDLIDSSAVHKTGEWTGKTMYEIGQDLVATFGLTLNNEVQLDPIPVWRLAQGSTVFDELEVMGRSQRALLVGEADGSLTITRADQFSMHAGALMEGVNIVRAKGKLSEKGKHSEVRGRGQKRMGSGKAAQRLEYVGTDSTVQRYRPQIVIAEGDIDQNRLTDRVNWNIARAAGWSTTAEVTVASWRDAAGTLWNGKRFVYLWSPKLKIDQVMA